MQPNSQYPSNQYPQLQPPQYSQYPQQYPQQYPMQYQQYPQPGMYQQPQVIATTISQNYVPVPSKEILIGAGGRQEGNVVTRGGFQKLDQQTGIFIKQKMELAELVLGCETQNKYNVYALDLQGTKKGRQIFKAKEKSDFCARYCLSGDCRPFEMNVSTTVRGEEDDEYEPFLHLERPCKCTCLCFNRPEVKVMTVEGGQSQYIGKIVDPWNFCNLQMDIYDKDHNLRYVIEGSCCQLGIWCKCPCDPCQTLDFDVKTPSGEIVSTLQKRTPGCLQALTTDMDSFALQFPKNCTTQDKALLMSAVLFLDYRHFEQNPRDRNHQNY